MQANDEVARRLAQLTVRAGEQRAQIHNEIEMMRSRPTTAAKSVGKDALKAAKALGLTDPKVAIPLARTVFIPAAPCYCKACSQKRQSPQIPRSCAYRGKLVRNLQRNGV